MKILLLDDHALFRAGLRLLLKTLNPSAVITEAGSLTDAMHAVAREADLSLCLLDLQLRGENGLEMITHIKTTSPDAAVVVVSGVEDPMTMRACIDAGAMGFIAKSSPPEQLAQALKHVLEGVVYLPAALLSGELARSEKPLNLSPRQLDVLRGLCRGLSTKAIARDLALSEHTVKDYLAALFKALDVHNRTEAVIKTGRMGLLPGRAHATPA